MNNQSKLKAVIEKAVEGGWDVEQRSKFAEHFGMNIPLPAILFSHSFAKAFWGEEEINAEKVEIEANKDDLVDVYEHENSYEITEEYSPLSEVSEGRINELISQAAREE